MSEMTSNLSLFVGVESTIVGVILYVCQSEVQSASAMLFAFGLSSIILWFANQQLSKSKTDLKTTSIVSENKTAIVHKCRNDSSPPTPPPTAYQSMSGLSDAKCDESASESIGAFHETLCGAIVNSPLRKPIQNKSISPLIQRSKKGYFAKGSDTTSDVDKENSATPQSIGEERLSISANGKRTDFLQWDDYFLAVAVLSSYRSKDPNTQVGACIVNPDKKIVGIGYNGFPWGCSDDELPWARHSADGNDNNTKYPYVCHAEMNAILNKNESSLKECTIYVVLFPCNECAKLIIQSGIRRIVYMSDKYGSQSKFIASKKLLRMAGVTFDQYIPSLNNITIQFPSF